MKSIRDTIDMREALRAILESRAGRPLSIRELSRRLGYNSDRTVGMVAKGERAMGGDMLRRISDFAKLSRKDKEYLALLAEKRRLEIKGKPLAEIERKLEHSRGKPAVSRVVDMRHLENLTAWYAFTLLEVLRLLGRPASPRAIHRELRGAVQEDELEQTLKALAECRFITRSEDGLYRLWNEGEYLDTPEDIPSVTIRKMHRRQLERAAETLDEQSVHEREMLAKTFTVSASRLPEFKTRIREVMEELAEEFVANATDDPVVVQLNQQLYQQTKPRAKRGFANS